MTAAGMRLPAGCVRLQLARPCAARRQYSRSLTIFTKAQPSKTSEVVDENINEYCSLDKDGKRPTKELTLGEKEQIFLEALSAYYTVGKPSMSDQEFDNLKEELFWEGSRVAVLSGDEQRFLEAQLAYNAGKPLLSDAEFSALKTKLRQSGSKVTAQGPRCSLQTQEVKADADVDWVKMVGLNVPPALVVLGAMFSIDNLTGVELWKPILQLPQPYGLVVIYALVLPLVYVLSNSIATFFFRDALILRAPCPGCTTVNTTYFGDILTVAGARDKNTVVCSGCQAKLTFDAIEREVVVTALPDEAGGAKSNGAKPKAPSKAKATAV